MAEKLITSIEQFDNILKDIEKLKNYDLEFTPFFLIAMTIEMLGAFKDKTDIDNKNQTKDRFEWVLKSFDLKYRNNGMKETLYKQYKESLVNPYKHGKGLAVTKRSDNSNAKHLAIKDGQLNIILEDFLEDLIKAKEKIFKTKAKQKPVSVKQNTPVVSQFNLNLDDTTLNRIMSMGFV